MKIAGIRQLTGPTLKAAAESGEPLGVSNGGVLCAVLLPVSPRWVHSLVEQNLSRLVDNIQMAEKDRANAEPLVAVTRSWESTGETEPAPPLPWRSPLRKVAIRKLGMEVIAEAAARGEALGVTNSGTLCAVLLPISPRWVESLVEQNLSRLLYNIGLAERERARGEQLVNLDHLEQPLPAEPPTRTAGVGT
ncbi:hypothetical protein [Frankia sp. R82]|uniref:hypothetical protein n=1 Tax=Frankia sp. R82 TaxID=2950553 RepID=UPI0020441EF0|nr:hypothetical protein [Frankia sp. R82]MCM3883331.1 hypothetical protein [Frankia sp. R82]